MQILAGVSDDAARGAGAVGRLLGEVADEAMTGMRKALQRELEGKSEREQVVDVVAVDVMTGDLRGCVEGRVREAMVERGWVSGA